MDTPTPSLAALKGRAAAYCAAEERCQSAVRKKLAAWSATPEETDHVIDALQDEGYLDDHRYARSFCECKMLRHGWGRRKVMWELRQKGVSADVAAEAIAALDPEALHQVLCEVADRKRRELQPRCPDPYVLRQRLTAYLAQRGYEYDEIAEVTK